VKTARSKGYAFLEFAERKVAEIAAKAMNNYLIFGR
jgi:RNA recognition motif-containing protein